MLEFIFMNQNSKKLSAEKFFASVTNEYDNLIDRSVPRHAEMLEMVLVYLPEKNGHLTILELGCGTGKLTCKILNKFPKAKLEIIDISLEMLKATEKSISNNSNIKYIQSDFKDLDLHSNQYDFVLSSISIHHLIDKEKENLIKKIFYWLKPKGILCFGDQFRGVRDEYYRKHIDTWKQYADKNGIATEIWEKWMRHQGESDYHCTIGDYYNWLQKVGFKNIDCLWRYALWAVLIAEKD